MIKYDRISKDPFTYYKKVTTKQLSMLAMFTVGAFLVVSPFVI